jgi:hypothetical protein
MYLGFCDFCCLKLCVCGFRPYSYVPPNYWGNDKAPGRADGFLTEGNNTINNMK